MAADQINPFSVRVLTLDSALRFVYFSVEESRKSLEELAVDDDEANEKGRQRAIRLFRALQSKIVDYAQLRGSFDNQREEELLVEELKLLQKEASIFLAKIKGAWQSDKAIKLLERTISLEKGIKKILKRLKRETPSESEYFYAGIDGGATHTKTVVSDKNGKIIGKAESGPSFPMLVGVIKTFDSLITGLKKATEDAGLNFETTYFRRICAGMCGIDTPEDHQRMNELMQKYIRRFHSNIGDAIIIQDSLLAWYGSFNGEPGIIIIGGTGHMVYGYNNGRDAAMKGNTRDWRKVVTIGGRFIAYHAALNIEEKLGKKSNTILVRALRSAFREGKIFSEYKNIAFTKVIELIKKSMLKKGAQLPDREIASMAKIVFESAQKGDKGSKKIIKEAAKNAGEYISIVADKIGLHNQQFKVAYIGSVIRHPFALMHLRESLPQFEPYAELVKPKSEPLVAGIEIAIRNIHFY